VESHCQHSFPGRGVHHRARRLADKSILAAGKEVPSFVTVRDVWQIGRYLPPDHKVSFLDHRTRAPETLCVEVDRAYYRLSLVDRIDAWFQAHGFDLSAECAFSRSDFEARLPVISAKAAATTVLRRREMPRFVKQYLQTPKPTLRGARAEWAKSHGASDREALDAEVHKQAKELGVPIKPGRRAK
jgi:hypothetical protein